MTFGNRVRELRKQKGLSQRELAKEAGIDFTYLSKIENDRTEPPSEKVIRKLARHLDVDADELIALAGKVPADLARILAANPEAIQYLRSLPPRRRR